MMNHDMYSSQLENRALINDNLTKEKQSCYHSSLYKFKDIEDIIFLAHRLSLPFFNSTLIRFENYYYLVVMYPEQRLVRTNNWIESLILEYGERGRTSIYRLQEYGDELLAENAIATIRAYFKPPA